MDRGLAREVGDMPDSIAEWEERVRANCERGWPGDWIERKYTPPDWKKVYRQLGGPPVWSTEDIEAYTEMLNDFTERLEPRDMVELTCTKEAADATWEAARMAREKNGLPEHKYQERLRVLAEVQRQRRAAESTAAKPATAFDHSLGLRAGFKHYQGFDIGQSRAIKRRDNAIRQIARWRDGLGAKARRLSDKFIDEQALVERYGATELFADAGADAIAADSVQAALPLASAGDAADAAPPVPLAGEAAGDAPALASSGETAQAVAPLRASDVVVDAAPPVAPGGEAMRDAPPPAPMGENPDATPRGAPPDEAAEAAPARAPADDEPINWVGWLTGAEKYEWLALSKGAQKEFNQPFMSKKWLVENLVVDRKVIRPDKVCPELAHYLPAIAQAAPTVAASAEAPQ
jgi:hypothetical protein